MKSLLRELLDAVVFRLLRRYTTVSADLLKLRATIWYVRGVKTARKFFLSFVSLVLFLMLAGGGFILLHIGLYKLLPAPLNAFALLSLGAIYMLFASLGLYSLCSEETWMKDSNAARFTEMVTRKDDCP